MKKLIKEVDGFSIYFEALGEDSTFDQLLEGMEEEDKQETIEQIKAGELVLFIAKVTAEKIGFEFGIDYLGGCIYESEEAFYTKYENDYFADMVDNAVTEARKCLKELGA